MPPKDPDTNRSRAGRSPTSRRFAGGGPGSSHQDAKHPNKPRHHGSSEEAEVANPPRSRVSGGGGEADKHHTHDPAVKS